MLFVSIGNDIKNIDWYIFPKRILYDLKKLMVDLRFDWGLANALILEDQFFLE